MKSAFETKETCLNAVGQWKADGQIDATESRTFIGRELKVFTV